MRKRILVVDDNKALLDTLSKILVTEGFYPDTVSSALEALKRLNENNYDLVLSDICMPYIDGLELIKRIKSTGHEKIPVIFMTANADLSTAKAAIKLGADDFVTKPFTAKEISQAIMSILNLKTVKKSNISIRNFLSRQSIELYFTVDDFILCDIPLIMSNYLLREIGLNTKQTNNLLICLEELLSNSFIHGVLEIFPDSSSNEDLSRQVYSKAEKDEFKQKKIKVNLTINQEDKIIEVEINDFGKGFDYETVLTSPPLRRKKMKSFAPTGRGLDIVKLYSDKLDYYQNGSIVKFVKKYEVL